MLLSVASWSRAGAQAETDVPIEAFAFQPATITVPVGTTVVWVNHDPVAHTVTDVDQLWDSGLFDPSGTFSKTFTEPGGPYPDESVSHTYLGPGDYTVTLTMTTPVGSDSVQHTFTVPPAP